ncbi:MAG: PSD1 domain-containing protein [Acidobacteria bacterium]|nr:PSD1 domain-containing protein [Acidobacteriota bacterium]MBI3279960.1 PSD1 domain-containing protein [Acidobacteriota bacterium]
MRVLIIILVTAAASAQDSSGVAFFETKIRPLFATRCAPCHAGSNRTAGLNLSTPAGILRGADSGAIISRDQPETSRLLRVIGYLERIKMPPAGKLSAGEIADITQWVKLGAPLPEGAAAAATAPSTPATKVWTGRQKSFWAFQPVQEHPAPRVNNTGWVKSPIDAFILAKLETKGLAPAPPAGKAALLRRATYDLTGLPPTPEEIDDFVNDRSPDAFARVIDRLLASPRYGERWGRHWLDVARYADSTGADEDHRYPYAWRYRDYVIEAFNKDLPYNRFVMEQIAGDLLPAGDGGLNAKGIVATGFLALGPRLIAEQDKPKMLYDFIDEQIDVTSRGILGLTVACARCHDHKFDPIAQRDYYALAGIFAASRGFRKIEGTVSQMHFEPLVPAAEYALYEKHQQMIADKKREIDLLMLDEQRAWLKRAGPKVADYVAGAFEVHKLNRPEAAVASARALDAAVLRKWIDYLKPKDEPRPHVDQWSQSRPGNYTEAALEFQREFDESLKAWQDNIDLWHKRIAQAREKGEAAPERPRFRDGNHRFFIEVSTRKGPLAAGEQKHFSPEAVQRLAALRKEQEALQKASPPEPPMAVAIVEGAPVVQKLFLRGDVHSPGDPVDQGFPTVLAGYDQPPIRQGSGRLELARWLADPEHPLTARVMVNRIWQWHFGEGLVRTASNWGALGERPTHPELLDWLTRRFIESGWSVKAMQRMIMLSSAYQMSSATSKAQADADPGNRLLAHFSRRRLDVEEIRDGMLAIDGTLDLTMGGTLQTGKGTDGENAEERRSINPATSKRRTVYLPLRRSNLPSLLNLFDFGDATTTTEARARTNVAPQALFMMNSRFVEERAAGLAKRLAARKDLDDRARLAEAYLITLARRPEAQEVASALDYIRTAGWESYCRILLASNEFVYVD